MEEISKYILIIGLFIKFMYSLKVDFDSPQEEVFTGLIATGITIGIMGVLFYYAGVFNI